MVEYFSEQYWDTLADTLNKDEAFQEKASDVDASLLYVAKEKDAACKMTIDGGKVTVEQVDQDAEADFRFIGPYETWVKSHRDGQGLQKLVMTGKLKFKGSIPQVMSLQRQLGDMTARAREIDVEY